MKNVLLIVPKYFGYESYIAREIEKNGYHVVSMYENLAHFDYKYRFISNYCKKMVPQYENNYYFNRIEKIKGNVDIILVIRGSSVSDEVIEKLIQLYPDAKRVMYQWDSVRNNPNAEKIASFFDSILTFDMDDAEKYGWKYRPLFYISDLCVTEDKSIDFACISSFQPSRVKLANRIDRISRDNDLRTFFYIFIPFVTFIRHKFLMHDRSFQGLKYKLQHKSIGIEKTNDIYNKSRIVFDYTPDSQNGFTMRTIESVGHSCKLITNNKKVLESDFYNPNNVYVYDDGKDFDIPLTFIESDYEEVSEEVYRSYSLSTFVSDLLM